MTERDWLLDWKICKKATPGPWVSVNEPEFDGAIEAPDSKLCIAQGVRANDKAFITEARTGWPAALRERARLEKQVRELEEEVRVLTAKVVALQENHTLFEKIIQRVRAICDIHKMCEQPGTEAKPFIKELNKLLEEWENAPIEF